MISANYLLSKLPYRTNVVLIKKRQTVHDIVQEVVAAHEWYKNDYNNIAEYFRYSEPNKVFRVLWDFLKANVRYVEEKDKKQTSKSPAHVLRDGYGDCKHYALFIGGVLAALQRLGLKFDWKFRFASYDPSSRIPAHVFVIAKDNTGEYWIDPVLSTFNNRFQPHYWVDKKINSMALYRIGMVDDSVYDTTDDSEVPPEIVNAIQLLMSYNVMNTEGKVNDRALSDLRTKVSPEVFRQIASARVLVQNEVMNGFFSTIWRGVKKVTLFAPRNAFLGLVGLNAFSFATKLKAAVWNPDGTVTAAKAKLKDLWQNKLGGDWSALENTIKDGARKRAIGCADGVQVGNPAAAAVPAWITTASAIIALLMPIVNAFLKTKSPAELQAIDPALLNAGSTNYGTGGGITDWIQQNPMIALALGAGVVYFVTKK